MESLLGDRFAMMTSKENEIRVTVFDDHSNGPDHFSPLSIEGGGNCQLRYVPLTNQDLIVMVKEAVRKQDDEPDVVLADHILDKTSSESQSLIKKGSSIVPIIRERWQKCPIISITAEPEDCRSEFGSEVYEEVFDRQHIASLACFLPSIVKGYKIAESVGSHGEILDKLGVPSDERNVLPQAMPDSLRVDAQFDAPAFVHRLYRWFRHTLHAIPGFLYDRRWAALTLGIDEKHFNEYEERIESCRYTGIWSDPNDKRWWKSLLFEFAWSDCESSSGKLVQEAACETLKIPIEQYGRCYSCKEPWPEALAFNDESPEGEEYPMHLRCSKAHPLRQSLPYFEERRVMLEAD